MKIFLDVGAHEGSTLQAVRDPKYAFDRIYCFEPASSCWAELESIRDDRVTICRFGLWNRTAERTLYDPGSRGASLFADKFRTTPAEEVIRLVRASDWFRAELGTDDVIYMKLNTAQSDGSGSILVNTNSGAKPGSATTTYAVQNQDAVVATWRIHRDIVP